MNKKDFNSECLNYAMYDSAKGKLVIEFVNGNQYEYDGVPNAIYEAFTAAESAGKFYNKNIRNKFVATRI